MVMHPAKQKKKPYVATPAITSEQLKPNVQVANSRETVPLVRPLIIPSLSPAQRPSSVAHLSSLL